MACVSLAVRPEADPRMNFIDVMGGTNAGEGFIEALKKAGFPV